MFEMMPTQQFGEHRVETLPAICFYFWLLQKCEYVTVVISLKVDHIILTIYQDFNL